VNEDVVGLFYHKGKGVDESRGARETDPLVKSEEKRIIEISERTRVFKIGYISAPDVQLPHSHQVYMKVQRIYIDTSVIGGCLDQEFEV
jgi:hypothetical protein